MSHQNDGVIVFQFDKFLFDVLTGDGIKRRRRFISQDDLRANGQSAGQTQPLLLPNRKPGSRFVEPVFHLIVQVGLGEVVDHHLRQLSSFPDTPEF